MDLRTFDIDRLVFERSGYNFNNKHFIRIFAQNPNMEVDLIIFKEKSRYAYGVGSKYFRSN